MKYAPKNANCTRFALKCESSKTLLRKGVRTSFRLVIKPHIKKSVISTDSEDLKLVGLSDIFINIEVNFDKILKKLL